MKSHGILSRYVRPGFKEGGTYDEKKREEASQLWKAEKEGIDGVMADNIEYYNTLVEYYGPELKEFGAIGNPYDEIWTIYNLAINPESGFSNEDRSQTLGMLQEMTALPIGTKEIAPGKFENKVLSFEDIENRRKNKKYYTGDQRDDKLFSPLAYLTSENEEDYFWDKRYTRYLNANNPKDFQQLEARRSYDDAKFYKDFATELKDFYYPEDSIYKDEVTLQEKDKAVKKQGLTNLAGIAKLLPEYGAAMFRAITPVSPADIKKYRRGEIESWWDPKKGANPAWGIYDSMIAPFFDEEAPVASFSEMGYLPGYSEFFGGKEGAGTNPYFGTDVLKPDESLYNESAFEVHPTMKMLIVEDEIKKAREAGDDTRADTWQAMLDEGKFPQNIDYSKFNRMNVQYNVPTHVGVNVAPFLLPGAWGRAARLGLAAKSAAATKAALAAKAGSTATAAKLGVGAGATKAGLAGAGIGTKASLGSLGVGAGGGAAEYITSRPESSLDNIEDIIGEEDFYNENLYKFLPSSIL